MLSLYDPTFWRYLMNIDEYECQVAIAAKAMAEIVEKTEIKTYGQFFQAWYNHLWHVFEAIQKGEKEPLLTGGEELKDQWDHFIVAWDAACDAMDENEYYYESFVVDVFRAM